MSYKETLIEFITNGLNNPDKTKAFGYDAIEILAEIEYNMPDDKGKALLTDIGTEELGHIEIICAMIHQLTKGATIDELEKLASNIIEFLITKEVDMIVIACGTVSSNLGNLLKSKYINISTKMATVFNLFILGHTFLKIFRILN